MCGQKKGGGLNLHHNGGFTATLLNPATVITQNMLCLLVFVSPDKEDLV